MNSIIDDFKNAFRKPNNGLIQIILINVIIFLVLVLLKVVLRISDQSGIYEWIYYKLFLPAPVMDFLARPWTLFTYMFIHSDSDVFHILFNMLFLYWFGKLVDEYLGNRRLINLYILGGLAGGILYLIVHNTIPYFILRQPEIGMVGASAAVYAVVVGAATLMPNYTFFLFLIGPVKIKYIAAFYVVMSFAQTIGNNSGGNVAHLGGALMGFIFITQLKKGTDLGKPLTSLAESIKNLFRRKPAIRVTHHNKNNRSSAGPASPTFTVPNQDEIDAILDKISRSGYESLTKEEKQKLFRASQKN
jgi:membrane associated rhomboid family serine protease